jgi:hypothetical protein
MGRLATAIVRQGLKAEIRARDHLPLRDVLVVAVLCGLATLVGPYSWRLYAVLLGYIHSSVPYAIIIELQALNFREPAHYVLVLIIAAAFFVLGWRRSRDPFELAMLTICTLIGFRMTRDSWVSCVPALMLIGSQKTPDLSQRSLFVARKLVFALATAVATAIVFVLITWDTKTSNETLARVVASEYPAKAVEFIQANSPRAKIYNDMNWGGFLIWALPDSPVTIDNRTDLYGDERINRFYLVQRGILDWRKDPDLGAADLIILNRQTPLTTLLALDGHFQIAYQDSLAVIFKKEKF